jgi:hypothetical protein
MSVPRLAFSGGLASGSSEKKILFYIFEILLEILFLKKNQNQSCFFTFIGGRNGSGIIGQGVDGSRHLGPFTHIILKK